MKTTKYYFQADILRALSALGVVILHSFDSIYFRPDFLGGNTWWFTHIVMSFFRTAVPIFILLSGYLNLGKNRSFSQSWNKLKKRILVPFFSFFSIYIIYDLISKRLIWNGWVTIGEIYNRFNINTQTLLYFLIILFFLYLLTPFFDLLFKENKQIQKKVIVGFLLIGALILIARLTTFQKEEYFYNTYNTWVSYIGYYLLGYYLKNISLSKKQYLLTALIFITSLIITIFGTYFMFVYKVNLSSFMLVDNITYFSNYQSINVIFQSISFFILVVHSKFLLKFTKNKFILKSVKFIAQHSFGIFLIHILVLYTLNFSIDNFFSSNILVFLIINTLSCLSITMFITYLLRKTPFKTIIGE